jgi:hypothetical protein
MLVVSWSKEVARFFFGEEETVANKITWTCRSQELTNTKCSGKGSFTSKVTEGTSNLRKHLDSCIPEWQNIYAAAKAGGDGPVAVGDIRNYVKVDKVTNNLYGWIDWVVTQDLPFSFVENEKARKYSSLTPIARLTLMRYFDALSFECDGILCTILPEIFALFFDGWDAGNSTNYYIHTGGIMARYYLAILSSHNTWP